MRITHSAFGERGSQRIPRIPSALACNPWLVRFWCQRSDDFFETWVAPQRVPKWKQLQLAVGDRRWWVNGDLKLLAGDIFVASPRCDHRQITDHAYTIDCIFFHRKKLDCAPPFSQCVFFSSQSSINQTKHAPRWAVIWLSLHHFLVLCARRGESNPCLVTVVC